MAAREMWMEVHTDRLKAFMNHRKITVRELATRCVIKDERTGKPRLLSPSMVGHLRSGARKTCSLPTAAAIERALEVPPGLLFTPRSSTVNKAA